MAAERLLLLATRSKGKLRELKGLMTDMGISAVDLESAGITADPAEEGVECFETFEENALAKARYFCRVSGGMPALADDSGLCMDAIGGAPGVRSKRYSERGDLHGQALDDANNAKLQVELAGAASRAARYVCAAALVHGARELVTTGEIAGHIISTPRGAEGFGYDPYFFATELQKTFGEAGIEEKAAVSHRGRAFRSLFNALREYGWA